MDHKRSYSPLYPVKSQKVLAKEIPTLNFSNLKCKSKKALLDSSKWVQHPKGDPIFIAKLLDIEDECLYSTGTQTRKAESNLPKKYFLSINNAENPEFRSKILKNLENIEIGSQLKAFKRNQSMRHISDDQLINKSPSDNKDSPAKPQKLQDNPGSKLIRKLTLKSDSLRGAPEIKEPIHNPNFTRKPTMKKVVNTDQPLPLTTSPIPQAVSFLSLKSVLSLSPSPNSESEEDPSVQNFSIELDIDELNKQYDEKNQAEIRRENEIRKLTMKRASSQAEDNCKFLVQGKKMTVNNKIRQKGLQRRFGMIEHRDSEKARISQSLLVPSLPAVIGSPSAIKKYSRQPHRFTVENHTFTKLKKTRKNKLLLRPLLIKAL